MPAATGRILLAAAIALGMPGLARADAVLRASHRTELIDCAGAPAVVEGDGNRVVFHGNCASLRLDGNANQVEIDLVPGGSLRVTGEGNDVRYAPTVPGPVVAAVGTGNSIAAGTGGPASAALAPAVPAAPPPPPTLAPPARAEAGTLLLRGDGLRRRADCAGRNVLIEGNDGHFALTGGCRSVTVQGQGDVVQAELQPGGRIAIGGNGVTLHYRLTRNGPPPVISVTGSNSVAHLVTGTGPAP